MAALMVHGGLLCAPGAGEPVRRQPPVWFDQVAPLVSPAEPLLAADTATLVDPEVGGLFLLDEEITYRGGAGASGLVIHRLVRPTTQAGVEAVASVRISYLPDLQSVVVLRARTIRPDGSSQEVGEDAAFIRTPQLPSRELYSDLAELTLVFPDVRPGHVVEYAVLLVQERDRIPGELTALTRLFAFWPVFHGRYLLDLPVEDAARLTVVPVGSGVPEVQRSEPAPGRVRLLWEARMVPRLVWEPERQPVDQGGPALWVTTLPSWDALASWYGALLSERAAVPPELSALAATWAPDGATREGVVAAYLARVAEDVRYTGLEFGIGRLQPRPPGEVWASGYGDCKDKANLLRVLLAERGVAAHLALVNTDHDGRLETMAPTYQQFDHAVVAVETDDGYQLCDPTAPYLLPGQLPAHVSGRQALVVRGGRGELVEIPPQSAGAVDVQADLQLSSDRSLRGWLGITASGVLGAAYTEYLLAQDPEHRRDRLESLLEDLFPTAELVDVDLDRSLPRPGEPCAVRLFVVVPPSHREGDEGELLYLPGRDFVLPNLGPSRDRATPYWQKLQTRSVRVSYALPDDWAPAAAPPAPLVVDAPAATAGAAWSVEPGRVVGELRYSTTLSTVTPAEVGRLRRSITAVKSWLETGVRVAPQTASTAAVGISRTDSEADLLPLMPTGDGQLRLVDHLYPVDGAGEPRRRALEQVLQLFPDDPRTVFRAEISIAAVDRSGGRVEEAARRLESLRSRPRGRVDVESALWADHLLAICFQELGRVGEARELLLAVASEAAASVDRRAWATLRLAWLDWDDHPRRALEQLRAELRVDSPVVVELYSAVAALCLEQRWSEALGEVVGTLADVRLELASEVVSRLGEDAVELVLDGDVDRAERLVAAVESGLAPGPVSALLDGALAPVREALARHRAARAIVEAVTRELGEDPPEWWERSTTEPFPTTLEEAEALLERLRSAGDVTRCLRCGLEIVVRFGTELEDPAWTVWQVGSMVAGSLPDDPLLDRIVRWLELAPGTDAYWEGRFLLGGALQRRQQLEAAAELYRGIASGDDTPAAYRVAAQISLAEVTEAWGDHSGALVVLGELAGRHGDNPRVVDALVRALLLNLELGRVEEALACAQALRSVPPAILDQAESATQGRQLLALTADPDQARRYWSAHERWWGSWLRLQERAGLAPPPGGVLTPYLPDLHAYGQRLGVALRAGDRQGMLELYRKAVHGARWQPELVVEVSSLTDHILSAAPEVARTLRAFVVALNTDLATDRQELLKNSYLQLVIQHLDGGEADLALPVIREFFVRFPDDSPHRRAMVRLHGIAAVLTGEELAGARAALERQLGLADLGGDRGHTVTVLARVLRRMAEPRSELDLLTQEVEVNPLPASDSAREALARRLQGLRREGEEGHAFTAAVAEWFGRFEPPWFELARPHSLADPDIVDLEQECTAAAGSWSREERCKLCMLVATEPTRPIAGRAGAFASGVELLLDFRHRRAATRAMLAAVLDDSRFGHDVHSSLLFTALYRSALANDRTTFSWAAQLELLESLGGHLRDTARELEAVAEVSPADRIALAALARRLTSVPLTRRTVAALGMVWFELAELGAVEELAALEADAASLRVGEGAGESPTALRLRLQRLRSECERQLQLYGPLRDLVAARFDLDEVARPEGWEEPLDPDRFWLADDEERLALRLYLLRDRDLVNAFDFWSELAKDLERQRDDRTLCGELIRSVLQTAPDDDLRSEGLLRLVWCLDLDEPGPRAQFTELTAPYRDPQAYRSTFAVIRTVELILALREGKEVEPEDVLAGLRHPFVAWVRPALLTEHYLSQGDIPGLRRLLRTLEPEQLLREERLAQGLRALDRAGLEAERALVQGEAERALNRSTVSCWANPEPHLLWRVFELSDVLSGVPSYPAAWLAEVTRNLRNPGVLLRIRLHDAELRGDWGAAADAARALVSRQPTLYDLYWNFGRALARSGETERARDALQVFVTRCRSSEHRPEAEALLAALH